MSDGRVLAQDDQDAPAAAPGAVSRTIARHGATYLAATALQAVCAALALPLAAHFVSPKQYGIASLVLIISLLFNVLAMAGLPMAALRLYFDERFGPRFARQLYAPATALALTVSLAAFLVLVGLNAVAPLGHYWPALLAVPLLTWPTFVGTLSSNLLQAEKRSTAFAVVAVMRGGVNTGAGVLAVIAFGHSASAYLAGYVAGTFAIAATGVCLTRPVPGFPARADLHQALKLGLPSVPAAAGVFMLAMADRFPVQAFGSAADVGRYQLAYAVGSLVFTVLIAINFAWLPQVLSAPTAEQRTAIIRQVGEILQGLAMVAVAGVALLGPIILPLVLSAQYHPLALARVADVVALGALAYVPYMAGGQVLFATTKTRPMSWITPTAVVVELAAGVALVPLLGLVGAAIASTVAYACQAGLTLRVAARFDSLRWLSSAWLVASLPGAAGWACGFLLPTGALGNGLRIALVALLLGRWTRTGLSTLRRRDPVSHPRNNRNTAPGLRSIWGWTLRAQQGTESAGRDTR